MRTLCYLIVASIGVGWMFGQSSGPLPSGKTRVALNVVVSDMEGNPITNLTANDFTLVADGAVQTIQSFEPVAKPWNFLLLFDRNRTWLEGNLSWPGLPESGSRVVSVNDSARMLGSSINNFLTRLRPQDRVSVAAFEDSVVRILDWREARVGIQPTNSPNQQLPVPLGPKDFYGALGWAVKEMNGVTGRKAVIAFTDARDGRLAARWFPGPDGRELMDPLFGVADIGEEQDFQTTLDVVRKSGVPFFVVRADSDRVPEFLRPQGKEYRISSLYPAAAQAEIEYQSRIRSHVERLAEDSGGRAFTSKGHWEHFTELHLALGLGHTYTLEFVPAAQSDGLFHPIEVRVPNRNVRITQSRKGYLAR